MVDKVDNLMHSTFAAVQLPFSNGYSRRGSISAISAIQSNTRSLHLSSLILRRKDEADGFRVFTGGTFGRNFLEIALDLGKRSNPVEVLGQVEWYERRATVIGHAFSVGVSFVDVAVEALSALRNYLQQTQSLMRQGSPRRRGV
jgi:hypothetical protein